MTLAFRLALDFRLAYLLGYTYPKLYFFQHEKNLLDPGVILCKIFCKKSTWNQALTILEMKKSHCMKKYFNPFVVNAPFLYSLNK